MSFYCISGLRPVKSTGKQIWYMYIVKKNKFYEPKAFRLLFYAVVAGLVAGVTFVTFRIGKFSLKSLYLAPYLLCGLVFRPSLLPNSHQKIYRN